MQRPMHGTCEPSMRLPTLIPTHSRTHFVTCNPIPSLRQHASEEADSPIGIRILTINCGSLRRKVPHLLRLVLYSQPDVVLLQEVGTLAQAPQVPVCWQVLSTTGRHGGGLSIFIHRRVSTNIAQIKQHAYFLHILVTLHNGAEVNVVNAHFPPSLPAASRRAVLASLSLSLTGTSTCQTILGGDMNDDLPPAKSLWLSTELSERGLLHGFWCPYRPRNTNFVRQRGRVSARTID